MKLDDLMPAGDAKRRMVDPGTNLVPMINIIFLLLIFFLVAGQIQSRDGLDLTPPEATAEAESVHKPARLVMDRNLALFLDREPITLQALRAQAESLKPEAGQSLTIEVDRDVRARDLDALLALLREAGVDAVRLMIQVRAST